MRISQEFYLCNSKKDPTNHFLETGVMEARPFSRRSLTLAVNQINGVCFGSYIQTSFGLHLSSSGEQMHKSGCVRASVSHASFGSIPLADVQATYKNAPSLHRSPVRRLLGLLLSCTIAVIKMLINCHARQEPAEFARSLMSFSISRLVATKIGR